MIIIVIFNFKNKLIEGHISGDINSNDQIYTHCQSNLNGQFTCSVSGGGQYLLSDDGITTMPNNVRNRDGDIYTPYGWELHNCSEITEEEECPSACDGAVIYPESRDGVSFLMTTTARLYGFIMINSGKSKLQIIPFMPSDEVPLDLK